jgi:hypothetical protein
MGVLAGFYAFSLAQVSFSKGSTGQRQIKKHLADTD